MASSFANGLDPGQGVASTSNLNSRPHSAMKATDSSSSVVRPVNPQLTDQPYFSYPTPTPEQTEEELPPYFEGEDVPLGPLLDRLVRRGYGDLRYLLGEVLPPLSSRQRPKHIIDYAKTTRQALIKYLAVLRWKTSVDLSTSAPGQASSSVHQVNSTGAANFPTPHSNGSDPNDTSPAANVGKGKGKAQANGDEQVRGRVADARRIAHFMGHQNKQHEDAVEHVRHVTKVVEGLRERNPDLLTALALLASGTYHRLPTSVTEPFAPKPPLTNGSIVTLLNRLNRHIRYRLRCLDYVPPEITIDDVSNGQVHLSGGGPNGWKARMTVVGFKDESRWWLTGVEWCWASKQKGVDDPGGEPLGGELGRKRFEGEERQGILDLANMEVLAPRDEDQRRDPDSMSHTVGSAANAVNAEGGVTTTIEESADGESNGVRTSEKAVVGSPLVRIYNFLQHLSLSYQLELLFQQAMALSQGKWRGQLLVEIDRTTKTLKVKYWLRPRPVQAPQQPQQAAVGKRPPPPLSTNAARTPMVGGILSISLAESDSPRTDLDSLLGEISSGGVTSTERVVRLQLTTKWEIGEIGTGGGLKAGESVDSGLQRSDPTSLDFEEILFSSTRAHAAHLTRAHTSTLLSSPRFIQTLINQPSFREADNPSDPLPLILVIPLPSRKSLSNLTIGVSALNGLIEIGDDGAAGNEARLGRVKLATASINEGKTRLADDIGRLTVAVVMENMEDQMRQLGWKPTRRLALRSQDLAKADLHPATTIFVPLPASTEYYFIAKISPLGLSYDLLRVTRVPLENGLGRAMKLAIGERTNLDLGKIRLRRRGLNDASDPSSSSAGALFEISNRDLRDMFVLANALVAQRTIEQQLQDRMIPFTAQYPPDAGPGAPRSKSPLAGMIPTLCVDVRDLLKDGKNGGAAIEVALPRVGMQIEGWWTGGRCEVTTIVQLRPQSSMSQASPGARADGVASSETIQSDGISFDPATSVVTFRAREIERCVPAFLEQWERLSKVIVVAGEVNRLNKLDAFSDVRMLSFDLRTATLSYAEGYIASITYTPTNDSYQVVLSTAADDNSRNQIDKQAGTDLNPSETTPERPSNPHSAIAPLLSARLNELTAVPSERRKPGAVAREFIGLLRGTLPFLLKTEALKQMGWGLVVLGASWYRLVKDHEGKRYAMDVSLLPSLEQFIIRDGLTPRGPDQVLDSYTGLLTRLPIENAISTVYSAEKSLAADTADQVVKPFGSLPPLVKLDAGRSLMVEVGRIGRVTKNLAELVGRAIMGEKGQ
ncbi:hypothetical protein IAU60_000267 [Kwoniella sp. DSM 27419]